jgi:hypothetical protein
MAEQNLRAFWEALALGGTLVWKLILVCLFIAFSGAAWLFGMIEMALSTTADFLKKILEAKKE